MHTALSVTETFHEPGLPSGMRRCSKATKVVPAALMLMFMLFGASAYAGDGPYVGIGGGLSMLNDASVTAPAGDYPALNATATTNDGFAIRGMAGYAFPNSFRVEAEIDYRQHKTDKMDVKSPGGLVEIPAGNNFAHLPEPNQQAIIAGLSGTTHTVKGDFSMVAFMGNVDYDFDTGSRWVPYVGGGLGVATISIDTENAQGVSLSDDSDTVFAYQVGAGLGYEFPLEAGRSVTVSLDWRYFATQDPTFKGDVSGEGDVSGGEFDVEISGHDIGIGLIYGF